MLVRLHQRWSGGFSDTIRGRCSTRDELRGVQVIIVYGLEIKYGFKDGGPLRCCLGIQTEQNGQEILNHQSKYCNEILDRFGFGTAHASATPMETNAKYSKVIEESDEQDPTFNSENMKVDVSADTSPAVMNLCALEAS